MKGETAFTRRSFIASAGTLGVVGSTSGCVDIGGTTPGNLRVDWTSGTATEYQGNHHMLSAATYDGDTFVGVPRNDFADSDACGVVALDNRGEVHWEQSLPPERCNAHAVGHMGVGDLTGDDRPAFLATLEPTEVAGYDVLTGEETFRYDVLETFGYSAPVTAPLSGDGTRQLVVVDFRGYLVVINDDGTIRWERDLDGPVFVTPFITEPNGNGDRRILITHGDDPNKVSCFGPNGDRHWYTETGRDPPLAWAHSTVDGDELVFTSSDDTIFRIEPDGRIEWSNSLGGQLREARIGAADERHAYVSTPDGALRAIDVENGDTVWREAVIDDDQRLVAPRIGSFRGEGNYEVCAVGYDGLVGMYDATTGELLGQYEFDTGLSIAPITADVDGDGRDELLVLHADATVSSLTWDEDV